jgi:hypothetical protein
MASSKRSAPMPSTSAVYSGDSNDTATWRAKLVDFVWLCFLHNANEVTGVTQVTIVQLEVRVLNVLILVDVIDVLRIERRSSALDAMNDVSLF